MTFRSSAAILLSALALVGCATTNGGGLRQQPEGVRALGHTLEAAAPAAVTLTWTMPRLKANGDTLGTAPLDWQAAYSTQSDTYVAHRWAIVTNADSMAFWWPTVEVEAERLVVASGTATPGSIVAWPALPVMEWDWPYSWWIRTRQRPNGNWSLWSNPVTRADNQ